MNAAAVGPLLEAEGAELGVALRGLATDPARSGVLSGPLRYALEGGGKRLRGTLCVLAYRTLRGEAGRGIYLVAAALELVHTYSLIHDDLPCMDDDDLRRGRPTLHRVFGTPAAAVSGLGMIPLAFGVLLEGASELQLNDPVPRGLALALARGIGAGGMVGGQWLDLQAEGRGKRLGLAALEQIHAAKTGALFRAALEMGALAARGTGEQVEAMGAYGANLGLAFQVVDDLLDETADSAVLGKTAGKDRRQDKATYPALLGSAGARARARTAVADGVGWLHEAGVSSAQLEAVGEWVLARHH